MSQTNYSKNTNDYIELYSECIEDCKHCSLRKKCEFYTVTKPKRKGKKVYKEET